MVNLGQMLEQLREERGRTKKELNQLDEAIAAFERLSGTNRRRGPRAKQRVSAATRRRMAKAQKARWANIRRQGAAKT